MEINYKIISNSWFNPPIADIIFVISWFIGNRKHISFATHCSQSIAKNAILGMKYVMVHKTIKYMV
jgi:hypothetical protein